MSSERGWRPEDWSEIKNVVFLSKLMGQTVDMQTDLDPLMEGIADALLEALRARGQHGKLVICERTEPGRYVRLEVEVPESEEFTYRSDNKGSNVIIIDIPDTEEGA